MKKTFNIGVAVIAVAALLGVLAQTPIAQSVITWEGVLPDIFTGTSGTESINVALTSTQSGLTVDGGNFIFNDDSGDYDFRAETDAVATAFKIDGADDTATFGTGMIYTPVEIASAQSYTLGSVGKAGYNFLVDSSGASGAFGFVIDDSEQPTGRELCVIDVADASTNNITIVPDAGTINGAANITISTQYGSACIVYDGTNYWIKSGDL